MNPEQLNAEIKQRRVAVCVALKNSVRDFTALRSYAQSRIETLKNDLCAATSWEDALRIQGQVREARKLAALEDEINSQLAQP